MKSNRLFKPSIGAAFCAGLAGMLAQVILLRELLTICQGNELIIGFVISIWLLFTAGGAAFYGLFLQRLAPPPLLAGLLFWLVLALPTDIFIIRHMPGWMEMLAGEQLPISKIFAMVLAGLLPLCPAAGAIFPALCNWQTSLAANKSPSPSNGVGGIYAADALGSMLAGGLFCLALVNLPGALSLSIFAGTAWLTAAWLIAPAGIAKKTAFAALAIASLAMPAWRQLAPLEWRLAQIRWQNIGLLPRGRIDETTTRIEAACESRFGSVALFSRAGLYALYNNGQVAQVFPDAAAAEYRIHFIMAQNPAARRVLLIGGQPADDLKELLKYPTEKLVCLQPDKVQTALPQHFHQDFRHLLQMEKRVRLTIGDAMEFIRQCTETFDAIIVAAPPPETLADNRFYTAEFFKQLRRITAPAGFICIAFDASEHLHSEITPLSASVYRALKSAFTQVHAAGGIRQHFFAGSDAAPLTLNAETLYQRARLAGISCRYFAPEALLAAEELDETKNARLSAALTAAEVPANTVFNPITARLAFLHWLHMAGLPVRRCQFLLRKAIIAGIAAFTLIAVVITLASRHRNDNYSIGAAAFQNGFYGLAMELLLIFIFQNLFGNIYANIALLLALWMAGLAAGALLGGRNAADGAPRAALGRTAFFMELFMSVLAAGTAALLQTISPTILAAVIYALAFVSALAVGRQFVLFCRLWRTNHNMAAVAWVNALDLLGAAGGGILTVILLLPVFGVRYTLWTLAAAKVGGAVWLSAGRRLRQTT